MRVAARWGVAVGGAAVLLGHLGYWYWPRERSARQPSPEAAELFADPTAAIAVWVPYPHQNLGQLDRFVGDVGRWGALLAGRELHETRALPRFGPFAVPPSSEIAWTLPTEGGLPRAVVRFYPSIAWLARSAGRLAGNPWLAGGTVDEARGRTVAWRDELWQLDPVAGAGDGSGAAAESEAPTLARVRSAKPFGPLPAGSYRLVRGESGLELRLGRTLDRDRPELPEGPDRPIALQIQRIPRAGLAIFVVWEDEGAIAPIPASAAVVERGAPLPRLLGEEVVRLAGRRPYRAEVGKFEIAALRERDLERAEALIPALERLAGDLPGARLVALVDPAAALRVAGRLRHSFGGFAFTALFGVEPDRWSAILAPWHSCGPMALVVSRRADAARAWLCPPVGPSELSPSR